MNESLFLKYVSKFFPKLQTLIEKINGKRNGQLTYLHKDTSILRREYAPDNKWESASVNTTFVAADIVAVDSELPIKSRDKIAAANGKLPKIGIQKVLKESDINNINVMEAQGGNAAQIASKLANDAVACDAGLDERNEFNFLFALSNGYVAIQDEDNENALLRLNFNYLDENCFGASEANVPSLEDIKRVITKADGDGNSIQTIWIAKSMFDKLRQTRGAKELVANYKGQSFSNDTNLATPTASVFQEAFADDNNGIQFKVVDRSVITEANGVKKTVKPWNANKIIFACNTMVGALVYGRLAEQTNKVNSVTYSLIDNFKLISKYSLTNPLREVTSGQAFVAPIIEDVDQIYTLDVSEAQPVETTMEAGDGDDTKVTVWGVSYNKANFISAMKAMGISIAINATDATIVSKVNQLSDADENKLKAAVEGYKA